MIRSGIAGRSERGVSLVISLILLLLITVMVTSSFVLTNTNLKSVTNTQFRNEAIAAANAAIERVISSPFTTAPQGESVDIDIDDDGVNDYTAQIAVPTCVSATGVSAAGTPPSSVTLPGTFNTAAANFFDTVWDIDASVTDNASGTRVRVRQGVRVLLTLAQRNAVCP